MPDRGQLYTLEGITAGLVVLLGLFFALQATTATPGAAGTINPHTEQQDRASVQAVLNGMNHATLKDAVLFWKHSGTYRGFHCSPKSAKHYPGYADVYPGSTGSGHACDEDPGTAPPTPASGYEDHLTPNEFGAQLNERFGEGYSYNVVVRYHDPSAGDGFGSQLMVYQGQPDASAVRATAAVTLMDDDRLRNADQSRSSRAISDDPDYFYAPDNRPSDDVYNELYVEVIVWRS